MHSLAHTYTHTQRPTAKELLKNRFIKNAKKNSCLTDLIERYRRWKAEGKDVDSGSEQSDEEAGSVGYWLLGCTSCSRVVCGRPGGRGVFVIFTQVRL